MAATLSSEHLEGQTVGDEKYSWKLVRLLGKGTEGHVYLATNDKQEVALKVAPQNSSLYYEKNVYLIIGNFTLVTKVHVSKRKAEGVPKLLHAGLDTKKGLKFIALELLDKTLEEWFNICNRKFSLQTVSMIAISLLNFLEHIHEKGYVFRDLSPKNFMTGRDKRANSIFAIDFGVARQYIINGVHRQQKPAPFEGTADFASLHALKGNGYSRRSDIESLGYLLIYFANGGLCWHSNETVPKKSGRKQMYQKIAQSREKIPLDKLCCGLPEQFVKYVEYARQLEFTEKPDYDYLRGLFSSLQKETNPVHVFDWQRSETLAVASAQGDVVQGTPQVSEVHMEVEDAPPPEAPVKPDVDICIESKPQQQQPGKKPKKKSPKKKSPKKNISWRTRSSPNKVQSHYNLRSRQT